MNLDVGAARSRHGRRRTRRGVGSRRHASTAARYELIAKYERGSRNPWHRTRTSISTDFVLNNGSGEIPALGFGTSLSDNTKTRHAVKTAVEVGFRHLDAAERYRNEAEVGAALKELFADGTVRREDLFVTTKLWNNNHRPERVKPALQASLHRLGVDAVDLYLVHTPFAFQPGDDQDPRHPDGAVIYDDGVTLRRRGQRWKPLSTRDFQHAIGLSDIEADRRPRDRRHRSHHAGGRGGGVAPISPAMGTPRIVRDARDHPVGVRVAGHALRTTIARRPAYRVARRALAKDSCASAFGLGHSTRHRGSHGSVTPSRIKENFDVTALPESAIRQISERLETRIRFNSVGRGRTGFCRGADGQMTSTA